MVVAAMTTLADITFTPKQQAELNTHPPDHIQAWINILDATPGIKSKAGWLLAAVRTGQPPGNTTDARERLNIQQAERLITNIGANIHTEAELTAELFAPPDLTADTATLEHTHATLTPDQRHYLGPPLNAQIQRTRTHGRQPIPGTGGTLHHHDTPANRQRLTRHWWTIRSRYEQAEHDKAEAARQRLADELAHHDTPNEPTVQDLAAEPT
jgi:hypothetical protein